MKWQAINGATFQLIQQWSYMVNYTGWHTQAISNTVMFADDRFALYVPDQADVAHILIGKCMCQDYITCRLCISPMATGLSPMLHQCCGTTYSLR